MTNPSHSLENLLKIMTMVKEGKISAEEGSKLIAALNEKNKKADADTTPHPSSSDQDQPHNIRRVKKKLRVLVNDGHKKNVNLTVPLSLAKVALGCIPPKTKDKLCRKGINLDWIEHKFTDGCCDIDEPLINIKDQSCEVRVDLI